MAAFRGVGPRKAWLAGSSRSYASTSTIVPPTPSTSRSAPTISGATSCTERSKNSRPRVGAGGFSAGAGEPCSPQPHRGNSRDTRVSGRSPAAKEGARGGTLGSPTLKELLRRRRPGGRLEQPAGAAAQVAEVDAAGFGLLDQPLSELERLVDQRRGHVGRVPVAHVVEDRPLGPRRDDRVRDPVDPDARPAAAASLALADRLERVDPVCARVLPEPEEDHWLAVGHAPIIAARADAAASLEERVVVTVGRGAAAEDPEAPVARVAELVPDAGRDGDGVAGTDAGAVAVELEVALAFEDEVDLFGLGVVVALRRLAGLEGRLGEALVDGAAGREAAELADRAAVGGDERLRPRE